jgi:predicted histidine transporter YuiF (NhaC family)
MEEIEVPTEHLQEKIHEEAEEKMREAKERWTLYVALSTAFMAVLAAIAGLLSGHHVNEALIEQIKSSDQWNYYQSKSIKSEIAGSTALILQYLPGKPPVGENKDALARYEKEKEVIKQKAEEDEKNSENHLRIHVTLSKAVTIFQIAIAISAISILTRKKELWYGGLVLTIVGVVFLVLGVVG